MATFSTESGNRAITAYTAAFPKQSVALQVIQTNL